MFHRFPIHFGATLWLFNIAMENDPEDFPFNTSIYEGFSMAMSVITKWYLAWKLPDTSSVLRPKTATCRPWTSVPRSWRDRSNWWAISRSWPCPGRRGETRRSGEANPNLSKVFSDLMLMLWWVQDDFTVMIWWFHGDDTLILNWLYGDFKLILWCF